MPPPRSIGQAGCFSPAFQYEPHLLPQKAGQKWCANQFVVQEASAIDLPYLGWAGRGLAARLSTPGYGRDRLLPNTKENYKNIP